MKRRASTSMVVEWARGSSSRSIVKQKSTGEVWGWIEEEEEERREEE